MFSIRKLKVSAKSHQNFCTEIFCIILTIIVEDLYFTEHSTVAVYLNFTDFVDAENVLLWKSSSSRKFNLHIVYMFISSNRLGIPLLNFDTLIKGSVEIVRACYIEGLACLRACKFACLIY